MKTSPKDLLGKIVDLMRASGWKIESPYDFENFMEDHSSHTDRRRCSGVAGLRAALGRSQWAWGRRQAATIWRNADEKQSEGNEDRSAAPHALPFSGPCRLLAPEGAALKL